MADSKLTGLTENTTVATTDLIYMVDIGTTVSQKATVLNIVKGALLDEDDFASDSANQAPTQQSTKAYIGKFCVAATSLINTLSLNIGGTEIISSTRTVKPVALINPDTDGIPIYAADGITMIAKIDNNGNLLLKGRVLTL